MQEAASTVFTSRTFSAICPTLWVHLVTVTETAFVTIAAAIGGPLRWMWPVASPVGTLHTKFARR
jgi:hypothetical protein